MATANFDLETPKYFNFKDHWLEIFSNGPNFIQRWTDNRTDIRTDEQSDRLTKKRTDKVNFGVASLLYKFLGNPEVYQFQRPLTTNLWTRNTYNNNTKKEPINSKWTFFGWSYSKFTYIQGIYINANYQTKIKLQWQHLNL